MNDPAMRQENGQNEEVQPNRGELSPKDDRDGDLQSIVDELVARADQGKDLQPILDDLVARGNRGEDLQPLVDALATWADQGGDLQPIVDALNVMADQGEDLRPIFSGLLSIKRRWRGPIPSPDDLSRFEAVHSGLADRIVSMAEREQQHFMHMESSQLEIERKRVDADIRQSYLGTVLGFIFAMSFLAVGAWLAANGHWRTGLPFGLIPPGILFTMFAYQFWPLFRNRRDDGGGDADDDK